MRQPALIGALLLVTVGIVLGATVFRTDIAQATGLAQSVTVNNTTTNPVPVREQNLDGGNIKVHEEGTAKVDVQNLPPAQTPYQIDISCLYQGHGFCRDSATVPDGKQFVIQTVSGWGYHAIAYFELDLVGQTLVSYYFPGTEVNNQNIQAESVLDARQVTLYVASGTEINFGAFTESGSESFGGAHISLSGYLIPAS